MADEERGPEGEKDPTGGAGPGSEEPVEFGAGQGPAEADTPGDPNVTPQAGGYAGRDPATEMPRIPSVPETQDDSDDQSHGGMPPQGKEPHGSE